MARCCNHRCHKQGQTGSQHLSLSLYPALTHTHTLSVAQNDLLLWTRVGATGWPLASIYQHWAHPEYCLSFWQEANQTNKRTNGEQEVKREEKKNKKKNQPTSSISRKETHRTTGRGSNKTAGESSVWLSITLQFLPHYHHHSFSLFFLNLNSHSSKRSRLSRAILPDHLSGLSSCYLPAAQNTPVTAQIQNKYVLSFRF